VTLISKTISAPPLLPFEHSLPRSERGREPERGGGQDLVPRPRRLALMNLFLHGVEPHIYLGDAIYEPDRGERYDVVLTNPPFGTKGRESSA
jgi:type I restriction-modification system DNA methylase subunit